MRILSATVRRNPAAPRRFARPALAVLVVAMLSWVPAYARAIDQFRPAPGPTLAVSFSTNADCPPHRISIEGARVLAGLRAVALAPARDGVATAEVGATPAPPALDPESPRGPPSAHR